MKRKNPKRVVLVNANKAVGYCRYSSDNQREESIEMQQLAIRQYATANGIIIIGWYLDRAVSAKNDNRPEFQRMVQDSEDGEFSKILVHKMDRFSRNIINFLTYEKMFLDMNIDIIYVAQPEMSTKMVKVMYATMAEQFIDNLSAEVTKGLSANAYNKGLHNGGNIRI
jgi:site-specific DNA recombinase